MTPEPQDAAVPGPPEPDDWWIPGSAADPEPAAPEVGAAGEVRSARAWGAVARVVVLGTACAVVAGAFAVAAHQGDPPTSDGLLGIAGAAPSPSPSPPGDLTPGPGRFDPWGQRRPTPTGPAPTTPTPLLAVVQPAGSPVTQRSSPAPRTVPAVPPVRSTRAGGSGSAVTPTPTPDPTGCGGGVTACGGTGESAVRPRPPGGLMPSPVPPGPKARKVPPGQAKKAIPRPPHVHPSTPQPGAGQGRGARP